MAATLEALRPGTFIVRGARRLKVIGHPRVKLKDRERGVSFVSRVADILNGWKVEERR